jgi:hypothetical protein
MKNFCLLALFGFVAGTLLAHVESAHAIDPFKKEFDAKYVKAEPGSPEETALAAAVKTAKCNVCHVGVKKKDKNAYGVALDALLDRKTDAKDKAKIQEALEKVATMKSDPNDAASPTFGELILQGKLPSGEDTAQAAAK